MPTTRANSLAEPRALAAEKIAGAVGAQSAIRDCTSADVTSVARLFQKTFGRGGPIDPAILADSLRETFFDHPWRDPELASKVSVDARGNVTGFIGILPVRMMFDGRPLRAAHAGSLMVDDPGKDPLIGARLFRAYLSGPQDLSFSESSNAISRGMWERLGGSVVPAFSMDWLRVFRPAGAAIELAREWYPVSGVLKPAAALADKMLRLDRMTPFAIEPANLKLVDVNPDDATLAARIAQWSKHYGVAPHWSESDLHWFLARAGGKKRYGELVCQLVETAGGKPVGCALYYARPGGIAAVLQMLCAEGQAGQVCDALLKEAYERGCVAIRGRTTATFLPHLQKRNCLFVSRSSLTFRTRDHALAAALSSGDALVTGLAGESWSRLIGGEFR